MSGVYVRKPVFLMLVCVISSQVSAGNNGSFSGSNTVTGNITNEQSIFVGTNNPAQVGLAIRESENFRFNFFPTFSAYTEVGAVDNFVDDLDELIDILDDPDNIDESVENVLDRFNRTLLKMGEEGYLATKVALSAPAFPFYVRAPMLDTVFSAEFSFNGAVGLRVLDDTLRFDEQNNKFATNTSAYVKSALESKVAFGGSKAFYNLAGGMDIYAGVKLNLIRLELSKQVIALQQMNGESVEDVVEDAYDENLQSSTNASLDIGVTAVGERYRIGAALTDINEPSFDYGAVGVNCDQYEDASISRSNCDTATYFVEVAGDIVSRETYTRHALLTLDGLYQLSRGWFVSGELETAAYDDAIGQENQWLSLALAYESGRYLLPSVRVGYRENLAGSELSMVNLGFTFGGVVTLDMNYGLESAEVDGDTVPRALGIALAIQEKF